MRDIGSLMNSSFFDISALVSPCLRVHSSQQYPLEVLSLSIQLHREVILRAGHCIFYGHLWASDGTARLVFKLRMTGTDTVIRGILLLLLF